MNTQASTAVPLPGSTTPSAFDPYIAQLLRWIEREPGGYPAGSARLDAGRALDLQPDFVDALLTSATMRGLLTSVQPSIGRRGGRIAVSASGAAWLEQIGER